MTRHVILLTAVTAAVMSGFGRTVLGDEPGGRTWLAAVSREAAKPMGADSQAAAEVAADKLIPVGFSIEYAVMSDYIWRGMNFSEFSGEGREKLNHQLSVGMEAASKYLFGIDVGSFGASFWWQWYAAERGALSTDGGGWAGHLQEVDYTLYWSYEIAPIFTTVETGWIAYTFPQFTGDGYSSYEWYVSVSLDDGKLLGLDGGIVNPTFTYYLDLDLAEGGSWMVLGLGHDFVLSKLGLAETPVFKDITVSPSVELHWDHRYLGKLSGTGPGTRLATIVMGLEAAYDLSGGLGIPQRYGQLTLKGMLYYSCRARAVRGALSDELWGGFSIGWEI